MLVKVGGGSALGVVYVTRFGAVMRCPSACGSQLRSLLAPSCTLMSYTLYLPVV
jgi:hypothetical protein